MIPFEAPRITMKVTNMVADAVGEYHTAMTASDVMKRSADIAKKEGELYGKLQHALLTPLIKQSFKLIEKEKDMENRENMKEIEEAYYRANKALQVIYHPPVYEDEDGKQHCSLSPVICEVTDYLKEPQEVAKHVARALNCHNELLDALEGLIKSVTREVVKQGNGYTESGLHMLPEFSKANKALAKAKGNEIDKDDDFTRRLGDEDFVNALILQNNFVDPVLREQPKHDMPLTMHKDGTVTVDINGDRKIKIPEGEGGIRCVKVYRGFLFITSNIGSVYVYDPDDDTIERMMSLSD